MKEAAMPKTSWIRPVVSIQYQLVTDGRTDTRRQNETTNIPFVELSRFDCVTGLYSASYVRSQRGTARIRQPHAAAAERPPCSTDDPDLLPLGSTAAAGLLSWGHAGTDRRTDTVPLPIDPASHTMRAVPITSCYTNGSERFAAAPSRV